MKQFYKSKNLLRLSFLAVLLLTVASVFNSCKDDDDEDQFQDHLVQFEAKIVPGTPAPTPPIHIFKTIVTQVGTVQNTIFDHVGLVWSSGEFFVNSSQSQLNFDANAELPNADSELILTLYIDGEVAKTVKATGTGTKSASIDYSFLEL